MCDCRLPIEDPYITASRVSTKEDMPFTNTANPLMTTLAFLSSCIDPSVAAEAAKGALKTLGAQSVAHDAAVTTTAVAAAGTSDTPPANTGATGMDERPDADATASGESKENAAPGGDTTGIGGEDIASAAKAALVAAADKARVLARAAEERMKSVAAGLVNAQLIKLEIKLRHFEELEALLEQEHQKVPAASHIHMHTHKHTHSSDTRAQLLLSPVCLQSPVPKHPICTGLKL